MLKRLNKKGQFYLIAAIIIAGVMIGLAAISNYSRIEPSVGIYDLREEIQIESRNTFDFGLNQGLNNAQFDTLMQNFTQGYIDYQKDKDLYFIFGKKSNLTISGYQKENKTVELNGNLVTNQAGRFSYSVNLAGATASIILKIGELQYVFPLNSGNEGRIFYFVLSQKTGEGEYIVSG